MNTIRTTGYLTLFAALQLVACDASAVSMGRLKGTALLGQPLEVVANLQFSADETAAADCVEATVLYGASQLGANQVSVTVLPSAQSQIVPVLVSTSAKVDEPVVTVTLTAGCLQKATRKYVLLSELASEPVSSAPVVSGERAAPTTTPVVVAPQANAQARQPAAKRRVNVGVVATDASAVVTVAKARKHSKKKGHAAVAAKDGVLKLTPPQKPVNATPAKAGVSAADMAAIEELTRRVEAISEWKAANEKAPDTKTLEDTIAALQQSLKVLQTVTSKNTKDLQTVTTALEASQTRGAGGWIYGLGGFAALILAFTAWVAVRARRSSDESAPWWGATQANESLMEAALVSEGQHKSMASVVTERKEAEPQAVAAPQVAPAPAADASMDAHAPKHTDIKRTDKRDFAHSGSATLRAINTKEMFDVRQQADFFMALGQHDEAIKVLEQSNLESEESNPLVLLDLLKIFHTLSRRTEFDRHRAEFNLLFTGIVPTYGHFLHEGNSLDSYPDIVAQLQDLWPSDDAMDYLEQCMVRTPEDDVAQGFDIEAFRDLLMLHAVLRRLDTAELDSNLAPFSANRAAPPNLAAADESDSDMVPLPVLPIEEGADNVAAPMDLELDIDLGDSPDDAKPVQSASGNLIDFDVNGLSQFGKPKA